MLLHQLHVLLHEFGIHHHAAHGSSPGSRATTLHYRTCPHLPTHHWATSGGALRCRVQGFDLLFHQSHPPFRIGLGTDRLHPRLKRGDTRCGRPGLRLISRLSNDQTAMQGCGQSDDGHEPGKSEITHFHDRSPISCGVPSWYGTLCHAEHLAPACLSLA
ncbi:conserved protein of unknown function [Thauera humireducens]|nr:conserved protein of unknown function [Thauera humireducens]